MGLSLVRPLFEALQAPQRFPLLPEVDVLTPDVWQSVADFIRKVAPGLSREQQAEGACHISVLQSLVDNATRDSHIRSARAYDMVCIIRSLVVSGYLKSTAGLADVLSHALAVSVREPSLLAHLQNEMRRPHSVATPSVLYRHRLTLHIGFCQWVASVHHELLSAAEGVVRWSTVDSSPQGGWDWLLSGSAVLRVSDCVVCFRDAQELIALGRGQLDNDETRAAQTFIVDRLSPRLCLTQGVPTGLGSGRSKLRHKVQALLHATKLMTQTWPEACSLLSRTFSFTGDLGTESRISGFAGSARQLMGDWIATPLHEGPHAEVDVGQDGLQFDFQPLHAEPPDQQAPDEYDVDLRTSMFIVGTLHVVHNATEQLGTAMPQWKDFIEQLTHVCRLLKKPWSRQRFLETCMSAMPHRLHRDSFAGFDGAVFEGRWATTMHAISQLIPLQQPLQAAWSLQNFMMGGGVQEDRAGGGSRQLRPDIVDRAVRNPWFWGYMHMADRLGETLMEIMGWAEGCPCHSDDPNLRGPARHHAAGLQARIGKKSCPLDTRRAPECAAGELLRILKRLLDLSNMSVLMDPLTLACAPGERAEILANFAAARRQLLMTFSLKLSHWQQLPHVLFGIAHHDSNRARDLARRALQIFNMAGNDASHHWISLAVCSAGSVGHQQMVAFIAGAVLRDLPFLESMASRLKFSPIAERWVESRHALMKHSLRNCPHASAQHVAFFGMMPALRKFLQDRPQDFVELVRFQNKKQPSSSGCFGFELSWISRTCFKLSFR
jgi:hypothetical protein